MRVKINRVDHEVDDSIGQAITAELEARAEELRAATARAADADARADAATKKIATLEVELKTATDPTRLDARASERATLSARAEVVAGKKLEASGSDHEIRVAALEAGGVKVLDEIATERRSDAVYVESYVAARFDAEHRTRSASRQSVRPVTNVTAQTSGSAITDALRRQAERTRKAG